MILLVYLIKRFLFGLLVVGGSIMVLVFLIEAENQTPRLTALGATNVEAVRLAAMVMLARIDPLVTAIFGVAGLWLSVRTGATNEITVLRATGTLGASVLAMAAVVAFFLGIGLVAIIGPVSATLVKAYESRVASLEGKQSDIFLEGGGHFWFRQVLDGQETILKFAGTDSGKYFDQLHVFVFDDKGDPKRHMFADSAKLIDDASEFSLTELLAGGDILKLPAMCLYNFKSWDLTLNDDFPSATAAESPVECFETKLSVSQIKESLDSPELISIWRLNRTIEQLDVSGFSTINHRMHLHMELAKPFLLAAVVLIGGGFTLRNERLVNTATSTLLAVASILAVVFVKEFARIVGVNETVHYIFAAWVPPAAALVLAVGLLSYQEGR